MKRGMIMASRCRLCVSKETIAHIIWSCTFSRKLWTWMTKFFEFRYDFQTFEPAMAKAKWKGHYIQHLWKIEVLNIMTIIWHHIYALNFEEGVLNIRTCQGNIRREMVWSIVLINKKVNCRRQDEGTVKILGLLVPRPERIRVHQVMWLPQNPNQIKANTDRTSLRNPVPTGYGVSFRNNNGDFLYGIAMRLGEKEIYKAECVVIVLAMEIAIEKEWYNLWIESDSQAVVVAFNSLQIPWKLRST